MIIKNLTITNSRGESIEFGHRFMLHEDIDLSGLDASVNYGESTSDGSHYYNSVLENRDISIPFFIDKRGIPDSEVERLRIRSYNVLNPKYNPMIIEFDTTGGGSYMMHSNMESSPKYFKGFENDNILWVKGLLELSSSDPYIYHKDEVVTEIAVWNPNFKFELEIPKGGIRMGYRSESLIVNIINEGVETGMDISFKARSDVSKPFIMNVETYERIELDIDMLPGDTINITIHEKVISAIMIRGLDETNIFNSITMDTVFFKLNPGDNIITYGAEEGADNLDVRIKHRPRTLGV